MRFLLNDCLVVILWTTFEWTIWLPCRGFCKKLSWWQNGNTCIIMLLWKDTIPSSDIRSKYVSCVNMHISLLVPLWVPMVACYLDSCYVLFINSLTDYSPDLFTTHGEFLGKIRKIKVSLLKKKGTPYWKKTSNV